MDAGLVDLSPARSAELVAPAVDRVFAYAMRACREHGGRELTARYGGPAVAGYLVAFRTRLAAPGGRIDPLGLAAVLRYDDPADRQRRVGDAVAGGLLDLDGDGGLVATERGHAFLGELWTTPA